MSFFHIYFNFLSENFRHFWYILFSLWKYNNRARCELMIFVIMFNHVEASDKYAIFSLLNSHFNIFKTKCTYFESFITLKNRIYFLFQIIWMVCECVFKSLSLLIGIRYITLILSQIIRKQLSTLKVNRCSESLSHEFLCQVNLARPLYQLCTNTLV